MVKPLYPPKNDNSNSTPPQFMELLLNSDGKALSIRVTVPIAGKGLMSVVG